MDYSIMEERLRLTLEDHRLSRGEKKALQQVFATEEMTGADQAWLRAKAFGIAREEMNQQEGKVVAWLEGVVKVIAGAVDPPLQVGRTAAYFSPGDDVPSRLEELFMAAKRSVDVCVFTITDDRIAKAILDAHGRGVEIRLFTDDDKMFDPGSDIFQISRAGIKVKVDEKAKHMHHKYAIFDRHTLLTGSYNWTRSAATRNDENVLVTSDPRLVKPFIRNFSELWNKPG